MATRLEQFDGHGAIVPESRTPGRPGAAAQGGDFGLGTAADGLAKHVGLELEKRIQLAIPPSTLNSVSAEPRSSWMASIRSAIWKATPSRVARAMSARVVARVSPNSVPRRGLPVWGASPVKAGTKVADFAVGIRLEGESADLVSRRRWL